MEYEVFIYLRFSLARGVDEAVSVLAFLKIIVVQIGKVFSGLDSFLSGVEIRHSEDEDAVWF